MNADERKALNKAIAVRLGWRVERDERTVSGCPVSFWSLYAPNGDRARSTIMSSTFGRDQLWRDIPDYCGSLDATAAVLAQHDVTLTLKFRPDCTASISPPGSFAYPGQAVFMASSPTGRRRIAELAALALDAWLTWRAEGEEAKS